MSLVHGDRAEFISPEKSKSKHIYVCDKRASDRANIIDAKKNPLCKILLIMSLSFHRVFSLHCLHLLSSVRVYLPRCSYYYDSSRIKLLWMVACRWNNGKWHLLYIIKPTVQGASFSLPHFLSAKTRVIVNVRNLRSNDMHIRRNVWKVTTKRMKYSSVIDILSSKQQFNLPTDQIIVCQAFRSSCFWLGLSIWHRILIPTGWFSSDILNSTQREKKWNRFIDNAKTFHEQ